MKNKTEMRILGCRRSGNHAIIQWIISQCKGTIFYFNNIQDLNPFKTYTEMYIKSPQFWVSTTQDKDYLICSYEDKEIGFVFNNPDFEKKHDYYIGESDKRFEILILRDPFNLFASRLYTNKFKIINDNIIKIWINHAKEFMGYTEYMNYNKTVINYNLWFQSKQYRKQLAEKLELFFSDKGINTVAKIGCGSSFDGMFYQKQAQKMKVLERWKVCKEILMPLLNRQELLSLSKKVFGYSFTNEIIEKLGCGVS